MRIRKSTQEDYLGVHALTAVCPPLENYPEHVYKIILRYFSDYCFIVEDKGQLIGFAMGILPSSFPGTYFLWDIGISPSCQGQGIGTKLIAEIENEIKRQGLTRIEVTIDPVNIASQKLFENAGFRNISEKVGETIIVDGKIAVKDHYKPGRHFMVYEKRMSIS